MIDQEKWDKRFLRIALEVSTWSKDPSTKVGAVVERDRRILSTGYNGFPRGVKDLPERYEDRAIKYPLVAHAEANALDNCHEHPAGGTMYAMARPCPECAKRIIQRGLKRVVFFTNDDYETRWAEQLVFTDIMFHEAGIEEVRYEPGF